mmetsp:Transcript_73115/g.136678  ORF Transcript_73115/g.136678 Transcript_73115/m.136678 type:complete len:296 (-) Transcript_73115:37-924(-)
MGRKNGVRQRLLLAVGICAAAALTAIHKEARSNSSFIAQPDLPRARASSRLARRAVADEVKNPIRTVSDTLEVFWSKYAKPPVLPMYRTFLIDFLTQLHLTKVNSRFKYDAIFALGMTEYYTGLMGNYDKLVGSPESEKIWSSMMEALEMDSKQVKKDAAAVADYAKSTKPAEILAHIEGTAGGEEKFLAALSSIKSGLYSTPFSLGLFKIMEMAGAEPTKANVEEWAKAMSLPIAKTTSDLETYRQNKNKLQQAEELLREVEIREKKKLAQRLEEKARQLQEKASGKAKEALEA